MDFEFLQSRLIATLKTRVRNGELTERRLGRLTGISQPHIHNVLKGIRILSPKMADRILRQLRISLVELLPVEDLAGAVRSGCPGSCGYRGVPVLEGWLGPGLPMPCITSPIERYPFPVCYLAPLERPLVARLAADPRMAGVLWENDLVLLDHSRLSRSSPKHDALFVVNRDGEGLIRRVRLEKDCLCVFTQDRLDRPTEWKRISLAGQHILDILRAKVIWVGRSLSHGC